MRDNDKSKWIPTEWSHVDDLAAFESGAIVRRMVSPFYEGEKFAVIDHGFCLNKKGQMEYERLPSSRTKAFYRRCRFDSFDEAIQAIIKYSKMNVTSRK